MEETEPLPSVEQLAESGGDATQSVRLLDLVLRRYLERRQSYAVHQAAQQARDLYPGSLLALWGQAWQTWVVDQYLHEAAPEQALRISFQALGGQQRAGLASLVRAYPEDRTGALALRLLGLEGWVGALAGQGPLGHLVVDLEEGLPDSACAAAIAMERGAACERSGNPEGAARYWLSGIVRYPFVEEQSRWRARLAGVLHAAGERTEAQLLREGTTDAELAELTEALIEMRRVRELAGESRHAQALEQGSALAARVKARAGTSSGWNELLSEIEAELARVRLASGAGDAADDLLARLRDVEAEALCSVLADAVAKQDANEAFCRAAFAVARERLGEKPSADARECWLALSRAAGAGPAVRAGACALLIEQDRYRLDVIQRAFVTGARVVGTTARSLGRMAERQEESLLDLLDEAERWVRDATPSTPVFGLADAIYACYDSLAIRDTPRDLYLHLARRGTVDQRYDLARRAETMGRLDESIEILAELAAGDAQPLAAGPAGGTTEELLRLLIERKDYGRAREVARAVAESATGEPGSRQAWQLVADLCYRDRDYQEAMNILDRLTGTDGAEAQSEPELARLRALTLYRLGDMERFEAAANGLLEEGELDRRKEGEIAQARAYAYLQRQDLERALSAFEDLLAEYELPQRREKEIRRLVGNLSAALNKPAKGGDRTE